MFAEAHFPTLPSEEATFKPGWMRKNPHDPFYYRPFPGPLAHTVKHGGAYFSFKTGTHLCFIPGQGYEIFSGGTVAPGMYDVAGTWEDFEILRCNQLVVAIVHDKAYLPAMGKKTQYDLKFMKAVNTEVEYIDLKKETEEKRLAWDAAVAVLSNLADNVCDCNNLEVIQKMSCDHLAQSFMDARLQLYAKRDEYYLAVEDWLCFEVEMMHLLQRE